MIAATLLGFGESYGDPAPERQKLLKWVAIAFLGTFVKEILVTSLSNIIH